ncbi:hypothetical protein BDW75DRAFT_227973 [Aspergillus navahoensis]
MSLAKPYMYSRTPGPTMVLFIAKYLSLNIEIVNAFPIKVYPEKGGVSEEYLSKFHTGKVPGLETNDGFCIYKGNAVAWLLSHLYPKSTLHGSNLREEITILRWFTNYELHSPIMAWIQSISVKAPSSPEILAKLEEGCELTVRAIEKEIQGREFLIGETLTLADLFTVSGLARGYQYMSGALSLFVVDGRAN